MIQGRSLGMELDMGALCFATISIVIMHQQVTMQALQVSRSSSITIMGSHDPAQQLCTSAPDP